MPAKFKKLPFVQIPPSFYVTLFQSVWKILYHIKILMHERDVHNYPSYCAQMFFRLIKSIKFVNFMLENPINHHFVNAIKKVLLFSIEFYLNVLFYH